MATPKLSLTQAIVAANVICEAIGERPRYMDKRVNGRYIKWYGVDPKVAAKVQASLAKTGIEVALTRGASYFQQACGIAFNVGLDFDPKEHISFKKGKAVRAAMPPVSAEQRISILTRNQLLDLTRFLDVTNEQFDRWIRSM
jgi:hypothetical protein